ncbi:flavohemoprotein [Iodidimonas muriae]|uniref:Flavohemoprotein n=1 Tax=Iodidimonas muriae TaxID=261467 RepID=A0ABQ2L865_9PROT|nr:NO-inducible flavohemoprotein [Iodidimonas muriae]GER05709.1 flavohemoprotein [Kordiimonadales bacterium JCM 17843]GGO06517.1 flavohemoprotein [Iodidimonas muriae]
MLSDQTIAIVKSTAPILATHGETLTRHFYQRMFSHNPEVRSFFNAANQSAGLQQRALAGAICAYAANIDNLGALRDAVELIAQKHASLQIKPEHYPIVGENLLASIREVLGEGATDEVIDAWAQAYGFLADILINREAQIYRDLASADGGWEGFKAFEVIKKQRESDVITSFYLAPKDGAPLPHFKPGQYITLRLPTPDGQTTMRNYSLSDMPGQNWFRISVKREDGKGAEVPGGFVSNHLHKAIEPGAVVEVAPPCGEFFLDVTKEVERPLVLLAAGVGITPILSILLATLETTPNRPILFVHGCLNERTQAFKETIDQLAQKYPNLTTHYRYSEPDAGAAPQGENSSIGFIDQDLLDQLLPSHDGEFYFCGPQPFMVNVYHDLLDWDIPPAQIHFEFFGPRQALDSKPDATSRAA